MGTRTLWIIYKASIANVYHFLYLSYLRPLVGEQRNAYQDARAVKLWKEDGAVVFHKVLELWFLKKELLKN